MNVLDKDAMDMFAKKIKEAKANKNLGLIQALNNTLKHFPRDAQHKIIQYKLNFEMAKIKEGVK